MSTPVCQLANRIGTLQELSSEEMHLKRQRWHAKAMTFQSHSGFDEAWVTMPSLFHWSSVLQFLPYTREQRSARYPGVGYRGTRG